MRSGYFDIPTPVNEPIKSYAPGTPERKLLKKAIDEVYAQEREIPMYIGGKEIREGQLLDIRPPHKHSKVIGRYYKSSKDHVEQAIRAALKAKQDWANMPWEHRAGIFLRAADLLADKYRYRMNAATMVGQSKNPYQAEIDAACEFIDFLRFNVAYCEDIFRNQPISVPGQWNRMEYRPLEGFLFALTPFNFTSIAGNLPTAPAMLGNTCVWKPSDRQVYSAQVIMEVLVEAGLPDGVINLVYPGGPEAGDVIFSHPDFAGIHFTGSTGVFQTIWKQIGNNINRYKSYPRIVGETGGKDFILLHNSVNIAAAATAIARGAFEYQGQKCSAASRVYIPKSIWPELRDNLFGQLSEFKMGPAEDFGNFINAVIDEKAFDKISSYIANVGEGAEVVYGGKYDKSEGYFIEPTIIQAHDPKYVTMCEEIFGPVLTVHVYDDNKWEETVRLVDQTSPYALTGAVMGTDRQALAFATQQLQNAAGNFYINDKPTGAVVGQQPFGGARASGTNDKAGSYLNLVRWTSPRAIKETFVPPTHFSYPFLGKE